MPIKRIDKEDGSETWIKMQELRECLEHSKVQIDAFETEGVFENEWAIYVQYDPARFDTYEKLVPWGRGDHVIVDGERVGVIVGLRSFDATIKQGHLRVSVDDVEGLGVEIHEERVMGLPEGMAPPTAEQLEETRALDTRSPQQLDSDPSGSLHEHVRTVDALMAYCHETSHEGIVRAAYNVAEGEQRPPAMLAMLCEKTEILCLFGLPALWQHMMLEQREMLVAVAIARRVGKELAIVGLAKREEV